MAGYSGEAIIILARILTALVGIPIVLLSLYLGGPIFLIFIALFSLAALVEFIHLLGVSLRFGTLAGLAMVLPYYLNLSFDLVAWDVYLLLYLLVSASMCFVFLFKKLDFFKAAGLIFSGLYVPALASTLTLVRSMENGAILALAVILLTWGTDTGAFFIGKLLGRGKLAPAISPNKSWAGAWGGLVSGIIIAVVFGILIEANVLLFALWGGLASMAGQIGDLCESAFKRYAGVKDSGTLLPGHGGFLDRIDSMLFTSAVSYIIFGMIL